MTHLLPLSFAAIFLGESLDIPQQAVGAAAFLLAAIFAAVWYAVITKPLRILETHTYAALEGNFLTAKRLPAGGLFAQAVDNVNRLVSKLQEALSRSQTEAEVIASDASRLRMILNSIKDGVLALDKNKHIILFNRAASSTTGLSIAEVAGRHINDVLPMMKSGSLVLSEWIDSCAGNEPLNKSWEGLVYNPSGASEPSIFDVDALYVGSDPNGVRTLVTFHNRTKEQQVEDMKVDFVALAAHELRTPVTIIRGYLEILQEEIGMKLDPEHREFIRRLGISTTQLSGSINNILHVSHIEHGELNLNLEQGDWQEIVSEACVDLTAKAESQGKKLVTEFGGKLPGVSVDKVSITEVISNLVDNAIKYSNRGQTVKVKVYKSDDGVITEVIDKGLGIPSSVLDKLFTKFYRSHRTRSSHRGTGLGLYVSKAIVEAHGGRIWVESREGKGSTFGFELPKVAKNDNDSDNSDITRGVHGWIKNHSLYRG